MKATLLLALVLAGPAHAAPSVIDWEFPRSDGKMVTFEMTGKPDYCVVGQSGGNATFTITSDGQTYSGTLCQQSTTANEFFGQFAKGADGQFAAFFVDIGPQYRTLMKQWDQEGGAGGDIGNSINGKCVDAANAFLTLPGPSLGDPNQNLIGFCMNPK